MSFFNDCFNYSNHPLYINFLLYSTPSSPEESYSPGVRYVSSVSFPCFQICMMAGIAMKDLFKSILEELQPSDVQQLKYILKEV